MPGGWAAVLVGEMSTDRINVRLLSPYAGSKLYILNGNFKCDKEAGCSSKDAAAPVALLRQVAASFDAGSGSSG